MTYTIMLFSVLLTFCFIIKITCQSPLSNHSIGPLAHCNLKFENSREYTEKCYDRCNHPDEPSLWGSVYLYSDVSDEGGPPVVMCTKVELSQTFTETWTFSQISSNLIRKLVPVTEDECQTQISQSCPDKKCHVKAPSTLTPEFHYASDTHLIKAYIELVTMPSGLDFLTDHLKIFPALSKESFVYTAGKGRDQEKFYIWDTKELGIDKCPFEGTQIKNCDRYGPPADMIKCRMSRFNIMNVTTSHQLLKVCPGLRRAPSGLLYRWENESEHPLLKSHRIAISEVERTNIHLNTLRGDIVDALSVIDEDLCHTQCETLDLMLSSNREKEILTRIGGQYLVMTKSKHIRRCEPLFGCKIIKPHLFCGNPTRIALTCSGNIRMWNPLKMYVEDYDNCQRVPSNSNLTITLGQHQYIVNDNLMVSLPNSEYFGVSHDHIARVGDKISADIVDPADLRHSWSNQLEKEAGLKSDPISITTKIENWEENIASWFPSFKSIGDWVTKIFSRVTLLIGILTTLFVMVIASKLWKMLRYTTKSRQQSVRLNNLQTNEESVVWL
ncbi:TPA_asm: G [Garlic alphacytorhabdovirus 1]|nr:TPA_asm: G [Garlic alphacytorhabdovirus 1]